MSGMDKKPRHGCSRMYVLSRKRVDLHNVNLNIVKSRIEQEAPVHTDGK